MYWSKLFIPTLREGDNLLQRAGYIREHRGGERSYLFLGRKSLRKIVKIVREELDGIGAQEVLAGEGQSMSELARELRSHKQLPQIWYQFRTDLEVCSFDASEDGLKERYGIVSEAFRRIIRRIFQSSGLELSIAGSFEGEKFADPEGDLAPEPFHTPGLKAIAELAAFTGLPETSHIKSLVMVADGKPVLALVRGDHQLSEEKLRRALRVENARPANAEEIGRLFGAGAGSLGPVGPPGFERLPGVRILADHALRGRRNMIAGANKDDYHLRHVTPGEDFDAEFFELRRAADDEELTWLRRGPIAGRIVEPHAESRHAGRYGIRIERLLSAAAEQHHDEDGLILPASIAPFDVIVTPVNATTEALLKTAVEIAEAAGAAGLDVLVDDRDERPGVKFKDADLIGVPWRVVVGKKVGDGLVEVVERRSKLRSDVPISEVIDFLSTRHFEELARTTGPGSAGPF